MQKILLDQPERSIERPEVREREKECHPLRGVEIHLLVLPILSMYNG